MTPKQRGLGRGLDALFEDEEATFAVAAEPQGTIPGTPKKVVGIGQLLSNPDQPRTHFDPEAINELAESIKKHGLLQPILVRPIPGHDNMYEIVAGERRWRACQKAQLHEVPVIIRDLDDSEVFQIAMIENLQRQDLNAMEEARGYQKLIDEFGFKAEDVGGAVGKSRSHVSNMTRLLSLPQSVQTMVANGQLSAGHARALINAKNPALLAQEVALKGLSVRETEKLAANNAGDAFQGRGGKASGKNPVYKDLNTLALEKDLSGILGLRVEIDMRNDYAGTMEIEFRTLDQLDDVILRLSKIPKVLS
jgi:ParB family chromosome partitioning protein